MLMWPRVSLAAAVFCGLRDAQNSTGWVRVPNEPKVAKPARANLALHRIAAENQKQK
jgi:hypothetical protein